MIQEFSKNLKININPQLIDWKYNFRHDVQWQLESIGLLKREIIIKSKRFGKVRLISQNDKFNRVQELINLGNEFKSGQWYQKLLADLQKKKYVNHKEIKITSVTDLERLFTEYLIPLVNSMRDGYVEGRSNDLGTIVIHSNGHLMKGPGATHRFYIAKILGLKSIPLIVAGIHEDWARQHFPNNMTVDDMHSVVKNHCLVWKPASNLVHTASAN